jgi:hypothetical protein
MKVKNKFRLFAGADLAAAASLSKSPGSELLHPDPDQIATDVVALG